MLHILLETVIIIKKKITPREFFKMIAGTQVAMHKQKHKEERILLCRLHNFFLIIFHPAIKEN